MLLDLDCGSVDGRWRWFGLRGRAVVVAFYLGNVGGQSIETVVLESVVELVLL